MEPETISWIIAGIVLLSSIFSPILVTFVNNKHQLKRDVIIPREKRKLDIYERYLQCIGKRLYKKFNDNNYEEEYAELYSIIWLYTPKEISPKILQMNSLIADISSASSDDYKQKKEDAKKLHTELCEIFGTNAQGSKYYKI